jgi:hypothetical protein
MATRLVEYREGGFGSRYRRWLMLLYSDPARRLNDVPLARATLDVREDPDRPGRLLVTVRGAARVTLDGREVEPLPAAQAPGPAVPCALSEAARASSKRRQCPGCGRGGALVETGDGSRRCRWCALVVAGCAA